MRNKYPWTNCLRTRHTAVGPIRFNSTASLPLCLSFPPSSTVLFFFFSPGLHLRPARSTYSLENDRSSVDFTRGGFSLGAASILSALSPLLPFSPLLLCNLMRGRDHLEYNFASFRIIIDFISRFSFLLSLSLYYIIFFNSSTLEFSPSFE